MNKVGHGTIDAGLLLRSLPFFALIVLAAGLSYRYHALLQEQRGRVDHTYQVMTRLASTLVGVIDAETGQRGFVITGEDRYLEPYRRAATSVAEAIDALGTLVGDSAKQRGRVDDLRRLVARKFAELQQTIDARERRGYDVARDLVVRDDGRRTMDALRAVVTAMEDDERALLAARAADVRVTEHRLLTTTILCTTLSLVARLGLAWQARRRAASSGRQQATRERE